MLEKMHSVGHSLTGTKRKRYCENVNIVIFSC